MCIRDRISGDVRTSEASPGGSERAKFNRSIRNYVSSRWRDFGRVEWHSVRKTISDRTPRSTPGQLPQVRSAQTKWEVSLGIHKKFGNQHPNKQPTIRNVDETNSLCSLNAFNMQIWVSGPFTQSLELQFFLTTRVVPWTFQLTTPVSVDGNLATQFPMLLWLRANQVQNQSSFCELKRWKLFAGSDVVHWDVSSLEAHNFLHNVKHNFFCSSWASCEAIYCACRDIFSCRLEEEFDDIHDNPLRSFQSLLSFQFCEGGTKHWNKKWHDQVFAYNHHLFANPKARNVTPKGQHFLYCVQQKHKKQDASLFWVLYPYDLPLTPNEQVTEKSDLSPSLTRDWRHTVRSQEGCRRGATKLSSSNETIRTRTRKKDESTKAYADVASTSRL